MPTNIEVKATLSDVAAAEQTARRLSGGDPQIIHQSDIFFRCHGARLKLRFLGTDAGELIRYERSDVAGARPSHYLIARTPDPQSLLEILSATLGTVGAVKKTRHLFLVGQTRVHLDHVEGLGDFLEFEVVLRPDQSESEGQRVLQGLLSDFHIDSRQLLSAAYVDLLGSAAARQRRELRESQPDRA
jgi:adenylate cyclase class IV